MEHTNVDTAAATIKVLFDLVFGNGFSVHFDQDIGALAVGQIVYLQLPHNADSMHDDDYDEETIEKCLAAVSATYSDADLSIMKITGSANISDIEIKAVTSSAKNLNDAGELIEQPLSFYVLNDTGYFYAIEEDQVHKYYTNNKSWRLASDIADLFDEAGLEELYNGGY